MSLPLDIAERSPVTVMRNGRARSATVLVMEREGFYYTSPCGPSAELQGFRGYDDRGITWLPGHGEDIAAELRAGHALGDGDLVEALPGSSEQATDEENLEAANLWLVGRE